MPNTPDPNHFDTNRVDTGAWKKKAMAFVTRSHRHLWGKNNEDPQAFLFLQGLNNRFVKENLLGWNKFGQERPLENWGLPADTRIPKKLFLGPGIVIPYIVEKQLTAVFIQGFDEKQTQAAFLVPGSLSPTLVLGKKNKPVAFIRQVFDGLFLFQELWQTLCVVIHPVSQEMVDPSARSMIQTADQVFIFSSDSREDQMNRQEFSGFQDPCFHIYHSKQELKALCSMD